MQPESEPGVFFPTTTPVPIAKPVVEEDEACLPWDLPDVRGATVSAVRLGVPGKARSQFEKACGAYKKKKLPEAEQLLDPQQEAGAPDPTDQNGDLHIARQYARRGA